LEDRLSSLDTMQQQCNEWMGKPYLVLFLDPEGGSQKATLVVVLLVVVISSLRVQKCLRLSWYTAERNETLRTHSCWHCSQTYTVSDLSPIF